MSADKTVTAPTVFPPDGRRVVIYALWDRRGGVEDYVLYALEKLREDAAHILVVANGSLSSEARGRLERVADEVLVRANDGYDIWAHKHGLDHLGPRLADFHEVVLTNDTWFGPVSPYGPVFERMNARSVHFWGMSDHVREEPNPFTGEGVLEYHLQSFWIAVRRTMFSSEQWRAYWRDLPAMPSYFDAVLKHETVFTSTFSRAGFQHDVAFGVAEFPSSHPALFLPEALLEAGNPLLKRRPFFHYPPFMDRHAVIGRRVADTAAALGYPVALMWQNLARNVAPRVLNTDASMMEILPDTHIAPDPEIPRRVLVVLHIHYMEMAAEMLDLAQNVPAPYDLVITTSDAVRGGELEQIVAGRQFPGLASVRVVASNDGRDQSAFLIGCRDLLRDGGYDLVVKLHSKKTPQDGYAIGRHFREQQFENLLHTPGYAANLFGLFDAEPGLGIVYPPMIHIGYPTMGHAWWANRPGVEELCEQLDIRVPLDTGSPLAPFGSMFVARPDALRLLVDREWRYEEFGGPDAYKDGGLAHVLERMPSYAAGELGYHTRTVATTEYAAISHTSLEFTLDQMSGSLPGDSVEQIALLHRLSGAHGLRVIDLLRVYVRAHHPRIARLGVRILGRASFPGRGARALRRRVSRFAPRSGD